MSDYIKFDTIKRKAIREFVNKTDITHGMSGDPNDSAPYLALLEQVHTGKPAQVVLEGWIADGKRIIDNWDVRRVGKLIELFPSCVPANWKGRKLSAEMADNANCDWIVYPA